MYFSNSLLSGLNLLLCSKPRHSAALHQLYIWQGTKKGCSGATDLMRMASVLLPPLSIVPINQKAICDAALNPWMSKMWQMMITWGKSMLITILLMVPVQEQHPSKNKSGKIHWLWKSTNLELALSQVIHLMTKVWAWVMFKKKKSSHLLPHAFLTSNILNKKKTKPALSYPGNVNTIAVLCESCWWVTRCSIAVRKTEKGEGSKILDSIWMLYYRAFLRGQIYTHSSLIALAIS